jgi:AcrR family transcriptional regulator
MVLKQGLLDLLANKPINQITIQEICMLADVNRGTFYKHYNDQYDLLDKIQCDLDSEIREKLENRLEKSSSSAEIIVEIMRCIAAQSALCKVLCSEYGDGEFLKKLMYNAHDQFIEEWKTKLKQAEIKQLDRFYTYTANGIVAVAQEWLQSGMHESPEEIASFIEKAANYGLSSFVNNI